MEAPDITKADVIYIGEENAEYIRKDALLGWANDNLLECEASNDDADYGRIDAFKKLIDKLNSI